MKLGDVDVLNAILTLERDVIVLQRTLNYIAANNRTVVFPSIDQLNGFSREALDELKKKYPTTGIEERPH